MKQKNITLILLSCFLAMGCAQTSVVMLDDSLKLAPSDNVRILEQPPEESFAIIARLETRGSANQSIPPLLNQMRDEAKKIGADAKLWTQLWQVTPEVIPTLYFRLQRPIFKKYPFAVGMAQFVYVPEAGLLSSLLVGINIKLWQ